jgi:hypothetical protein
MTALPDDILREAERAAATYHTSTHGGPLKHSTPELAGYIAQALYAERRRAVEIAKAYGGRGHDIAEAILSYGDKCPACDGHGLMHGYDADCPICNGTRRL